MKILLHTCILFLLLIIALYLLGGGNVNIYIVDDNPTTKMEAIKIFLDGIKVYEDKPDGYFSPDRVNKSLAWGIHQVQIKNNNDSTLLDSSFFVFLGTIS